MTFVIYQDRSRLMPWRQSWRWKLVASNGARVATSGEAFDSRANAIRAAENVRAQAGGATIDAHEP